MRTTLPSVAQSAPPPIPRPTDVPDGLGVEALAVLRGDRLVLSGLGFSLLPGGALLLRGPNGAGKSTLLRALAGLCPAFSGRIAWNGVDIAADPAGHAARCAYLGHQDALKPGLTLRENLRLPAAVGGAPVVDAAIDDGLARLDLLPLADLAARFLSAGQKRRAALARVALLSAPLWLLDEPTLGLDAAALDALAALLAAHRGAGGIVVAATHVPVPLAAPAALDLLP
ncbi:MAG: heme ABC exporter ATP-binding protein CcmA [Gluconacetobacter diazotrophicus]|nr:heme ABC exporter ATP-binding protein CcmA [Gluconacetobacter diazotrophicus]